MCLQVSLLFDVSTGNWPLQECLFQFPIFLYTSFHSRFWHHSEQEEIQQRKYLVIINDALAFVMKLHISIPHFLKADWIQIDHALKFHANGSPDISLALTS